MISRKWGKIGLIVGGLVILALYFIFDPALSPWAPKCMFYALTGYDCPGCGSQRMLHALLRGDLAAAWHANAFILCISPILVALTFTAIFRKRWPRLYRILNSPPMIIGLTIAVVVWGVLRNI